MPKRDNGHPREEHPVAIFAPPEQPKRSRGRPRKDAPTILGGPTPELDAANEPPAPPPEPSQLQADLREIAESRASVRQQQQEPLEAAKERLRAALAPMTAVMQQLKARFQEKVPELDAVIAQQYEPWPAVDPCQLVLKRATKAAEEARNAIMENHIGQLDDEIAALTADKLQSGWEEYLFRRIHGLSGLEAHIEEKLGTVEVHVGLLKKYAPQPVTTVSVERRESSPPQREAIRHFDPMVDGGR